MLTHFLYNKILYDSTGESHIKNQIVPCLGMKHSTTVACKIRTNQWLPHILCIYVSKNVYIVLKLLFGAANWRKSDSFKDFFFTLLLCSPTNWTWSILYNLEFTHVIHMFHSQGCARANKPKFIYRSHLFLMVKWVALLSVPVYKYSIQRVLLVIYSYWHGIL